MLAQDGSTSAGIEEQNEQQDEQLSVTSVFGDDHTIGTGNSMLEDPLQGIEDLQEATDGDDNDGGFAEGDQYFVGTSDPDGDGQTEETAAGHEVDLPDTEPTESVSIPTWSTGSGSTSDDQTMLIGLLALLAVGAAAYAIGGGR